MTRHLTHPRTAPNAERKGTMQRTEWKARARRIGMVATAATLATAGAALAHSEGGGVAVAVEGAPTWSLSPV